VKIDLNELITHHIIDEETVERIRQFYKDKSSASGASRFLLILSLIGIVLVGLGLILILAYNWDDFSKWVKITLAFLPLLIAQFLGIYVLRKKTGEAIWTESAALTIFFALGIAISLLSQIYHIEADLSGFLKWWIILASVLIFIFNSRSVSLAIWISVGWYLTTISWDKNQTYDIFPLLVILVISAWYVNQIIRGLHNNLLVFHHWTIPIVLTIFLFFNSALVCDRFIVLGCLILFLSFGAVAFGPFAEQKFLSNGYRTAQFLGIWIVGMIMTFDFFWSDSPSAKLIGCLSSSTLLVPGVFMLLLGLVVWLYLKKRISTAPDNMWWLGFSLVIILILGEIHTVTGQFLSNLIVLAAASKLIYDGVIRENLIVVNLGILALAVWIIAWFFGHDFSVIWKGLLFIGLGLLCFGINTMIIKKQKQ